MMGLTIENIVDACKGKLVQQGEAMEIQGISIDSRKLKEGDLFIPLRGERFDGHHFIPQVKESGAVALLTEVGRIPSIEDVAGLTVIEVKDTLRALQDISQYYKERFTIPFIGVTGSTGKTSTKDMISGVLSYRFQVLRNIGNFNNHIGLPLTLLNLEKNHEIAVLEMGMSGFGEIERLADLVRPSIGVITNIGFSHIENLGSQENILKAKMEIATYLGKEDCLLLNGDDSHLKTVKSYETAYKKVFFGLSSENDFYPTQYKELGEKGSWFMVEIEGKSYEFTINQPGQHNIYNALAAIWIGLHHGMKAEEIQEALQSVTLSKMRLEIIESGKVKIINDAYNASPDSMKAALQVLAKMEGKEKIAVLGNMFEMGSFSEEGHRKVGQFAAEAGVDFLITVGDMARWTGQEAQRMGVPQDKIYPVESNEEAVVVLHKIIQDGSIVLVKGSRGMQMEEIVKFLQERS